MPKTCMHLEKIEKIIKGFEVKYTNNRCSMPYGPCLNIEYKHSGYYWTDIKGAAGGENSYYFQPGMQIVYWNREDKCARWEHSGSTSENIITEIKALKEAESILNWVKSEITSTINECNCGEENNQQLVSLRRNTETDLSVVRREKDNLQGRIYSLESSNRSLETRNYDLQNERNNYQNLFEAGKREMTTKNNQIAEKDKQIATYSTQLTTSQNQLTQKDRDIEWGKGQLVIKEREKEQFKNERDDYKNKWVLSESEVKKITASFNVLQLEKNKKEVEISSLKEELESLQNVDIRYKERKLDELVRNSGLNNNRPRIINLRDAYVKLYKQDDIVGANREIETIKAELFQTNVAINDLHKIYKTCEKIAELKVKQEKLREQQQQYEARQEVPPRNN